jgi:hypothetical protein
MAASINGLLFQSRSCLHREGAETWRAIARTMLLNGTGEANDEGQSWLRKFGQDDKWNFCLTTGTLVPANQERQ